ncbi:hypothetical protein NDU88_002680 [Pleurodeles waltl]|uniref:Uncharacterized protein n=1 Tax=Pleurodeles waltl TaxID=8319 RepID=A0AAV7PBK4_PLEWA|nr:hypothetical protein NDU88_002680 [Pleurodeles waltl]
MTPDNGVASCHKIMSVAIEAKDISGVVEARLMKGVYVLDVGVSTDEGGERVPTSGQTGSSSPLIKSEAKETIILTISSGLGAIYLSRMKQIFSLKESTKVEYIEIMFPSPGDPCTPRLIKAVAPNA